MGAAAEDFKLSAQAVHVLSNHGVIERRHDKRAKTKGLNSEQKGLDSHGYDSHVLTVYTPEHIDQHTPVEEGERNLQKLSS